MAVKLTRLVGVLAVLVLFVTSCGDDDGGDGDDPGVDSTDDGTDDGTGDGDGDGSQAGGEFGTIIVNGDTYAVSTLNRCVPFSGDDDDLDLQALGGGVKINIYATAGTIDDVSVDGSTVRAEYGSLAFGADPVIHDASTDGGRATGSATVGDSTGSDETVELEWDVEIPDEVRDC